MLYGLKSIVASGGGLTSGGCTGVDSRTIVYRNTITGYSVPSGSWTKIPLDTVLEDNLNEFDESVNYRWTASEAGIYHASVSLTFISMGTGIITRCGIALNGTAPHLGAYSPVSSARAEDNTNPACSGSFKLSAFDYLEAWGYHNFGTTKQIIEPSVMSIHRIA